MSDYIKREDAYRRLTEYYHHTREIQHESLRIALIGIPSADVAPVRHRRWIVGEQMPMHDIKGNLSWGNWYVCTGCGFATTAIEGHITQYKYCPNCGARMDGGDEDEKRQV